MYVPSFGMYGESRKLQNSQEEIMEALTDVIVISILAQGNDEEWGERNLHFTWNVTDYTD